jgi:hypothetical protein
MPLVSGSQPLARVSASCMIVLSRLHESVRAEAAPVHLTGAGVPTTVTITRFCPGYTDKSGQKQHLFTSLVQECQLSTPGTRLSDKLRSININE